MAGSPNSCSRSGRSPSPHGSMRTALRSTIAAPSGQFAAAGAPNRKAEALTRDQVQMRLTSANGTKQKRPARVHSEGGWRIRAPGRWSLTAERVGLADGLAGPHPMEDRDGL